MSCETLHGKPRPITTKTLIFFYKSFRNHFPNNLYLFPKSFKNHLKTTKTPDRNNTFCVWTPPRRTTHKTRTMVLKSHITYKTAQQHNHTQTKPNSNPKVKHEPYCLSKPLRERLSISESYNLLYPLQYKWNLTNLF